MDTRLEDTRVALTHTFTINGEQCYITVGLLPNGQPGELFIKISKQGSTLGGFADSFGRLVSTALQYGVPLNVLCRRMIGQRFQPEGTTTNPEIPVADSIVDYIFKWFKYSFLCADTEQSQALESSSQTKPLKEEEKMGGA